MAGIISCGDCALCAALPFKLIASSTGGASPRLPAEVDQLVAVVTLGGSQLLRCPRCATDYFHGYEHQERDICTQESTDVTVRRYGPVAAQAYLQRVLAGGAAPLGVRQFSRAFLDGDGDAAQLGAATGPTADDDPERARAQRELDALAARYDRSIADLVALLRRRRPALHLQAHAVEALCSHFALRAGWDALRAGLLEHRAPRVRLAAAALLVNIGLGNLSSFDVAHIPAPVRQALAAELAQPARVAELSRLLHASARRPPSPTWDPGGADLVDSDTRPVARQARALLDRPRPPAG